MITIDFKKVSVDFSGAQGGRAIFKELNSSLTLERGEVLGLMGESGSGKSTLLRLIAKVISPTSGEVGVGGVVKGDVAYLPQGGVILDHLSVDENLTLFSRLKVMQPRFSRERLDVAVRALDIDAIVREGRPVQNLSGGERQRISLARLLSVNPNLVLLDEPCAAIGGDHRVEFLAALKRSAHQLGFAAVLASHDWQEHLLVATKVAFLKQANGAGLNELRVEPVAQFSDAPWHQEAVAYTTGAPVNWIDGQKIAPGEWLLSAGGYELASAVLTPDPQVTKVLIACRPDVIARSATGASAFRSAGSSDSYGFVAAGEKILVVTPGVATQTGQLRIAGVVQAYSVQDGGLVGPAMAS